MRYHHCTVLLSAVLFISVAAHAQTTQRRPGARPIPAKQVYGHLFYMLDTVEHDADGADGRGEKGKAQALRKHFQAQIGLTDAEASKLKSHAADAWKKVREHDDRARDIIKRIRAQTPDGKLKSRKDVPKVPKELVDLQDSRDRAITDHVAALQRELSAAAFQKVDTFAQTQYTQAKPRPAPQKRGVPRYPKPR
jgi:hypothetical protein